MTPWKRASAGRPDPKDAVPTAPDPLKIGNNKEFRDALVSLRAYKQLSLERLNEAATKAGEPLPAATVSATLSRDKLPALKFVTQYVQACGLNESERASWEAAWHAVEQGRAPLHRPRQTGIPLPRLPQSARGRWLIALATAVVVTATAGLLWRQREQDHQAAADAANKKQDLIAQQHKRQCGTPNPALLTTANGDCAGITDGRDGHAIFGKGLQPALAALDAENRAVTRTPGYVTVALLAPLTTGPKDLTGGRAVHQVEGVFTALHKANEGDVSPKIRLVLANMGSDEKNWAAVVDRLKTMTGPHDRLRAVTGMGLSQQESIDAARSLSNAAIPMVGDVITADGFDLTGAIDQGDKIAGLVRVAPNVSAQLKVISKNLRRRPELTTAALISTPFTPNGTPDLYTQSLANAFQNKEAGLRPHLDKASISFEFDVRDGAAKTSLSTISKNLCGKVTPDLVFFAGRATYLPTFLEALHKRQCRTTPITVVTGSDAATLDRKLPALNDPSAPISVLYVPLADPSQLTDKTNPDRSLFQTFADEFSRTHHGQKFNEDHLASGWAVMAHDAFLTASLAIRYATDPPRTPPSLRAVAAQLYLFDTTNVIEGASGIFRIDPQTGNRKSTHDPQAVRIGTPGP